MTEEKKGIVRMLAITFVVMLAIPLAYRVWITFNPPAPRERLSLAEFFDKATANRSVRLLKTPHDRWTKTDREAEPRIAAWLEAHSKIVLPWEWSSEARQKDPKGYRKAWKRLLGETESSLKDSIARIKKELKRIDRELLINQTLHIHLTNQIAALERNLTTNPLPATVTVERLSKGRFWGWNVRKDQVHLEGETNRIAFVSTMRRQVDIGQNDNARITKSKSLLKCNLESKENLQAVFMRIGEGVSDAKGDELKRLEETMMTNLIDFINKECER